MKLHIANTFFEWELTEKKEMPLFEAFGKSPIFLQLQFLPLLYIPSEECVLLTQMPPQDFFEWLSAHNIKTPKIHLLSEKSLPHLSIESWGASRSIANWAKNHNLIYSMPSWDVVCKVNSKAFSFVHSPKLEGSRLLYNATDAKNWMEQQIGPFVFKTCFGVSGGGHLIADANTPFAQTERFLNKEWRANLPVIAEPWVKRALDFSTQWQISSFGEITYLGSTLCKSDDRGRHKGNIAGKEELLFKEHLFFLKEHKLYALDALKKLSQMGFFGSVGIDAMLYYGPKLKLHPIVEINARKTMGYAAMQIQKLHYPNRTILLEYLTAQEKGFLPFSLEHKEKIYHFSKQLFIHILR
jgi:hypothetical protein